MIFTFEFLDHNYFCYLKWKWKILNQFLNFSSLEFNFLYLLFTDPLIHLCQYSTELASWWESFLLKFTEIADRSFYFIVSKTFTQNLLPIFAFIFKFSAEICLKVFIYFIEYFWTVIFLSYTGVIIFKRSVVESVERLYWFTIFVKIWLF